MPICIFYIFTILLLTLGDVVVDTDEHPRPATTMEQMAKLPAVFKKGGTVNAGNASVSINIISLKFIMFMELLDM